MRKRDKHFLVLEDDPNDALLIGLAFRAVPFCTVSVCRNPSETRAYALGAGQYSDRLHFPLPDGLICDLRLGPESGMDFLQWWASDERTKTIPFVMLAGSPAPHEILAAIALGATGVLIKPSDYTLLLEMIREWVDEVCGKDDLATPCLTIMPSRSRSPIK